jgi:hypothetical protein
MPSAEAHVTTDRANRYLTQLCSHLNHMDRMRRQRPASHDRGHGGDPGEGPTPPTVQHVNQSDTDGSVRFTGGLCTLHATVDTLTLRIDADDEATLQRLRNGITKRLEKVGRRDQLTVTWHRADTASTPGGRIARTSPPAATTRPDKPWWRRASRSTLAIAALAVLVIVGHAGVFGSLLAASVFEKWGLGVLAALIIVKILIGGLHLLGGGFALRRGTTLLANRRQTRHSPLRHLTRGHSRPDPAPATSTISPAPDQTSAAASHQHRT